MRRVVVLLVLLVGAAPASSEAVPKTGAAHAVSQAFGSFVPGKHQIVRRGRNPKGGYRKRLPGWVIGVSNSIGVELANHLFENDTIWSSSVSLMKNVKALKNPNRRRGTYTISYQEVRDGPWLRFTADAVFTRKQWYYFPPEGWGGPPELNPAPIPV